MKYEHIPMTNSLRNAFAPQVLNFGKNMIDIGDQKAMVYAITDFPPKSGPAWLARAANLPGVTLAMHGLPTDALELTNSLNRAITLTSGNLEASHQALTIQRLESQLQDTQTLMKKIDQEQQAVFTTGVFLLVTADDEVTCRRRSRRVQQTLAAAGMRARLLTHLQEQGLMAAGPWDMFPEELRPKDRSLFQISSETLAAAFPFSSGGVNHRDGVVLGSDSDGGIVIVNRWDLTPGSPAVLQGVTNRNFAILSPPGGGKSHTVKCTTLREWAMGAKVIIIDPEREYRSMVKKVGGAWLNAAGGGTRINPFQAPSLPPDTDDDDGEAMANQTTILIHAQRVQDFLSTYLPGLTPLQTALLDQGVEETYSKNGQYSTGKVAAHGHSVSDMPETFRRGTAVGMDNSGRTLKERRRWDAIPPLGRSLNRAGCGWSELRLPGYIRSFKRGPECPPGTVPEHSGLCLGPGTGRSQREGYSCSR
jgi:hypothetical protein